MKNKITSHEEIEFDNKRLVYVSELVNVNTHLFKKNSLSTEEIISLFDGGYRLAIFEQQKLLEFNSQKFDREMIIFIHQIQNIFYNNGMVTDEIRGLSKKLEKIIDHYNCQLENNLSKSFEICQYSNEKRVRDETAKERNIKFLNQLDGNHQFLEELFRSLNG